MPLDLTKTIVVAGVNCYDEGAKEKIGKDPSAVWTVVCDWNDRTTLTNAILGGISTVGVVTTIVRPLAYPDAPWMFAKSVETEGSGTMTVGLNGMASFQFCRIAIMFEPMEVGGDDAEEVGEENLDFSSEMYSFSRDEPSFKWESDGADVTADASPGKIISTITFTKTKKGITSLPLAALFAIAESPVNNATYLGAPAGKLRFAGAQTTREFTALGAKLWTLTVKLEYRPIEWNKLFRPDSGTFDTIITKAGGNPLYKSSDFSPLGLE